MVLRLSRPINRIAAGRTPTTLYENFNFVFIRTPNIDAHHYGLRSKSFCALSDQIWREKCLCIDRDFVGAVRKSGYHLLNGPNPTSPCKRHETGPAHRLLNLCYGT